MGKAKAFYSEFGTKVCTKCNKKFLATTEYFHRNSQGAYGLNLPCKQCIKKYNHERYLNNRDEILEISKLYNLEHREAKLAYHREYYHKNKEADHARCKRYANTERGRKIINLASRVATARRRERLRKIKKDFTLKDWKDCLEYFDNKCAYCGTELDNLTIEHFIPISSFGETIKTNIIPACKSCNCSKNRHDFNEWYIKQEFYDEDRKQKINEYITLGV